MVWDLSRFVLLSCFVDNLTNQLGIVIFTDYDLFCSLVVVILSHRACRYSFGFVPSSLVTAIFMLLTFVVLANHGFLAIFINHECLHSLFLLVVFSNVMFNLLFFAELVKNRLPRMQRMDLQSFYSYMEAIQARSLISLGTKLKIG